MKSEAASRREDKGDISNQKSLVVHYKKELSVGKEWFGLQEQMRCQQGKKY